MLEAGLVATSGLAVVCVVGILLLVAWVRSEVSARGEEQDKRRAAEEVRSRVERERDDALALTIKYAAERDHARAEVEVYAASAKQAREELSEYVRANLAGAPDDVVAAELDRLLQAEVRPLRGAGAASGGGDGGEGAPAVRDPVGP